MAVEAGHVQITEFSKEVIPQINWMVEDLFCQYGVAMPYFLLDFDFPDYSERPDWVSGYSFNLDWGPWGYWLPWFNELLGLLFDEAHLPRWQMPDLSLGSWAFFNDYVSELYDNMQRHYVYDQSGTFTKDEVIEGETSGVTGFYKWKDSDGYIHVANKSAADFDDEKIVGQDSESYGWTYEDHEPVSTLWSKLDSGDDVISPQRGTGGSEIGSPTYAPGKFGNGILIDANNEGCKFPTVANSINPDKGTIEVWWKPQYSSDSGDATLRTLWCFGDTTHDGLTLQTVYDWIRVIVSREGGAVLVVAKDQSWAAGSLYHLAVTWDREGNDIGDSKTVAIYKDNVEIESTTTTWTTPYDVNPDIYIGTRIAGDLNANAVIDNIKTYDVVKTDFSDKEDEDA